MGCAHCIVTSLDFTRWRSTSGHDGGQWNHISSTLLAIISCRLSGLEATGLQRVFLKALCAAGAEKRGWSIFQSSPSPCRWREQIQRREEDGELDASVLSLRPVYGEPGQGADVQSSAS